MTSEMYRIKHLIEDIIKEHNEIYKDIGTSVRMNNKGYNCFNLKEDQIITIAAGLVNRGLK